MGYSITEASFVMNEYRYEEVDDATVKSAYKDARQITFDTQLGDSDAAALAAKYLAEFKPAKRTFEIVFDGILSLDNLLTVLPSFTVTDPTYNLAGLTGKPVSVSMNHADGTTTVQVRL